jgi:hypothetical protein
MATIACLKEDIFINNIPLNAIDSTGCTWLVTELDGWWGPPPSVIPEDERPYDEDGNYLTAGRFGPRTIEITGYIIPPATGNPAEDKLAVARARDRLVKSVDMIRKTGTFTVDEYSGAKQAEVQTLGRPLVNISGPANVLEYNIQLIASDPRKYSVRIDRNTGSITPIPGGGSPDPGGETEYEPTVESGRIYDRTYPLMFARNGPDRATHSSVIYLVNSGDHNTYGEFRILGPVTDPKVIHQESGSFLRVLVTLDEGEYLDFDLKKRTIVWQDGTSALPSLDFSSEWFLFEPGLNTLHFLGVPLGTPQEGWAAATNLVTNPSAETPGASVVIRRNLARDPSFEARTGAFEAVKKNYAKNPAIDVTLTTVTDSEGFTSVTPGPIPEYPSTPLVEVLATADWVAQGSASGVSMQLRPNTEDNNTFIDITPSGLTLVPGKFYTAAATLQLPVPLTDNVNQYAATIAFRYTLAGNTITAASESRPDIVGERRVSKTIRIPEGATNIKVLLFNGTGTYYGETNRDVYGTVRPIVRWDNLFISDSVSDGAFFQPTDIGSALVTYANNAGVWEERRMVSPYWTTDPNAVDYLTEFAGTSNSATVFSTTFARSTLVSSLSGAVSGLDSDTVAVTLGAEFKSDVQIQVTPVLIPDEPLIVEGEIRDNKIYGSTITIMPSPYFTRAYSAMLKPSGGFSLGFLVQDPLVSDSGSLVEVDAATVFIDRVYAVDGTYHGPYFDGVPGTVSDMNTSWINGQVNGLSQAESPLVVGFSASPDAVVYRSRMWAAVGTSSLAVITSDTVEDVDGESYARIDSPSWNSLANGTYTVVAFCNPDDGSYLNDPTSRTITVVDPASDRVFSSAQAPVGQATRLILTFEKTGPGGEIRLVSNALKNEVVRWDGILVVAGEYTDRYFDGDTDEASWNGAPHASTSSQAFKLTIPAPTSYTEHRNAWIN